MFGYFDADIGTGNNHAWPVPKALSNRWNLTERGIEYVGANVKDMARDEFTVNGIDVGFLAYTYGTNGIPVPEGQEYLVNIIDMRITSDIRERKSMCWRRYHR